MNNPEPADLSAYELDDRPAVLVCPKCADQRKGKVFKSWWIIAEKRGDKNPWWKSLCDMCAAAVEEKTRKTREAEKPKVSEDLVLELPNTDVKPLEDE